MWKRLKIFLSIVCIFFLSSKVDAQVLTTTFTDPCTKQTTTFTLPIQGNTVIYFYGQSRIFTADDVISGAFAAWTNQVYSDYRKLTPCSVQSLTLTRNQITSQVIGNVVSSVVSSINSSVMAGASMSAGGGNLTASQGNSNSQNGKSNGNNRARNNNTSNSSNSNGTSSNGGTTSPNNQSNTTSTVGGAQGNSGNSQNNPQNSGNASTGNNNNNNSNGGGVGGNSSGDNKSDNKEGSEVVATTAMNVDVRNDRGSESSGSGGGKGGKNGKSGNSNPIIVSSDLTSAQNLDKSFTGIINVGMARSSLMGTSSWGVTGMVWFNLKQFAINSRYTMIKMNDKGTLKFVHNINLTGAYSYGNIFSFLGYSMIINAKKWGITGFNVSGALVKMPEDSNLFISPSVTGFYTRPFSYSKKLTISPEIYLISTPVVYSSFDKVTVTDRTFSMFLGSGFDYQISKRFKFNVNYKLNLSTNPEFPVLSFFLIGSKVNL
jgi:hypothetical protein